MYINYSAVFCILFGYTVAEIFGELVKHSTDFREKYNTSSAIISVPRPDNFNGSDPDAMQTFSNGGAETGAFFSHKGFYNYPRQPYTNGTRRRYVVILPYYCRAQLSLDMTNPNLFGIRDYDYAVMFDGALASNLKNLGPACEINSYVGLQQKGKNYQSVTVTDTTPSRTYLSNTNVAVMDFCADVHSSGLNDPKMMGFVVNWSCIRNPTNPTTTMRPTTFKTNPTTTTRLPTNPTTTKPTTTISPVSADCGVPINSNNRPATMFQANLQRIVGGVEAASRSWPWACALVQSESQFCDCAVLNNQWVVTAAHCVADSTEAAFQRYVQVYYGNQNLAKVPVSQRAGISRVIQHPNYNMAGQPFSNDIALIKLAIPIPNFPNADVSPVCLPNAPIGQFPAQNNYGKNGRPYAFVGGWGTLFSGQRNSTAAIGSGSDIFLQTTIEIFTDNECRAAFGSSFPQTTICGGLDQGGRDSCQGDSGGPLVMQEPSGKYALFGIVSFGYGCADAGHPGAYSNVAMLKQWIQDTIKSN